MAYDVLLRAHLIDTVLSKKKVVMLVLISVDEQQLVDYIIDLQDFSFLVSILQLKLRVVLITKGKDTPFTNGILGLN